LEVKLKSAGYETSRARDGSEALTLAGTDQPDVILMELLLPDTDGIELISTLKNSVNPTPIVIILSTRTADEDIHAALTSGASDYVTKPFSPQALLERIRVNLVMTRLTAGAAEGV
jgi:DNA-binding response OmpR family regulator